jgi:glycosyltransferase involved in cell wall biosynthesis
MYSRMDAIVAHAVDSATHLSERFGVPSDRVSVIRHGINNKLQPVWLSQRAARATLGLSPDDRVLLVFGNIEPYKGIEDLVEAVSLLSPGCSVKVVVAGRGRNREYLDRLRSFAAERRVGSRFVWHCGFVAEPDVETYFAAADCVVLPYRRISQSGVIFSAYRFGVPVIATAVGGLIEDVVEGQTGLLCEPENPLSLARAIENYFRDAKWGDRERVREAIICRTAAAYSWESIAVQTLAVYRRIARQGRRPERKA